MSNYSDLSNSVRVDFFREGGKYYCTEAIIWTSRYDHHEGPLAAFVETITKFNRLKGLIAVCLEPYHKYSYPLMYRIPK